MRYPRWLRVVTKVDADEENARIEVEKFQIPHEGDITIRSNGDILVLDVKENVTKSTKISKDEAINDTYSKVLGTPDEQKTLLATAKGIAKRARDTGANALIGEGLYKLLGLGGAAATCALAPKCSK